MISLTVTLPKSLLDFHTQQPMVDAVTLIPCGHVLSQKTADVLRQKGLPCPIDQSPFTSYIENPTVRSTVMEMLMQSGAAPTTAGHPVSAFFNETEQELFFTACEKDPDALEGMIAKGADVNGKQVGPKGQIMTPLGIVSKAGNVKAIRLLLSKGAHVDGKCKITKGEHSKLYEGWTPLKFAVGQGHFEAARVLLEAKADPNVFDSEKTTILMLASELGFDNLCLLLIQNGAVVDAEGGINDNASMKWTALMSAASMGQLEAAKVLLQHKADPNARASNGRTTPVFLAARKSAAVLQELFNYGANPHYADVYGKNAVHFAAEGNCLEAAQLLIEKKVASDKKTGFDGTPLSIITKKAINLEFDARFQFQKDGQILPEEPLLRAHAMMQLFLKNGADINTTVEQSLPGSSPTQRTLLMIATVSGAVKTMKVLLVNRANVNIVTRDAEEFGKMSTAQKILNSGSGHRIFDSNALGLAIKYTPIEVRQEAVQLLKSYGASEGCLVM